MLNDIILHNIIKKQKKSFNIKSNFCFSETYFFSSYSHIMHIIITKIQLFSIFVYINTVKCRHY